MQPASVPEGSTLSPLGAEASGGQKNNGNEDQRQNGDLTKIRRQNKTMGILQNLIRTRKRTEIGQANLKTIRAVITVTMLTLLHLFNSFSKQNNSASTSRSKFLCRHLHKCDAK